MIPSHLTSVLARLGVPPSLPGAAAGGFVETAGARLASIDPARGETIVEVYAATRAEYESVAARAAARFATWRERPAPLRGELPRQLAILLREHKDALAELITIEVGKIPSEARGEVQEMIDICDFAVGLSRQLHGLTIASERPRHRMMEQWLPLGPVAIVTAFNFPMAVWSWNAAIAAVCGDPCVWKPSPRAPLTALGVQALAERAMAAADAAGVWSLVTGGAAAAEWMADDARFPLVSFTGSTEAGRQVAERVARRLGRALLELGGNNAVIVLDDADLDLAVRSITFGAVGTAGQRCTSTRRVYAEPRAAAALAERLAAAWATIRIGDPREPGVLMGPLVSREAVQRYLAAIEAARAQGGEVITGGRALDRPGFFVEPALVRAPRGRDLPIAREETFAPILYLFEVVDVDEAIAANNAARHGLSSAIFTDSLRAAERFLSAAGSDCGIANVNLGTSGAEIGGAFGGEKDTGGGRESGSDAWKSYMRRQTCTVNWGGDLPLAQGVRFL